MQIKIDDLQGDAIKALLKEHHTDMYATSPKESVHTLGIDHLKSADITFFTAWEADQLLGCLAIKAHSEDQVELKSMRTSKVVRNKGVASQLLHYVLRFAKEKGFRHVHLETGTQDYFSAARQLYKKSEVQFNSADFESKQIFYASKDGTKIPMIITYKKGLKLDGNNPTLLYGYGGFGVNLTPSFSTPMVAWLENGGVYAVPNLRGGGEYGEEWHLAGTKMKKQNVFDDFISAAEYLIENKYSSSERLAIRGGSNGGLLVGACMAQRPELFKVALPAVGVMDMLRYHQFTAGAGWAYDYGTAEDSKEMFEYLKKYSPVHALKKGTAYPATMVTTADHDDRVVPAHSFKFAAELQHCHEGENPVLIRIESNAGHGAGKPTDMIIKEYADLFAFTLWNMGVEQLEATEENS